MRGLGKGDGLAGIGTAPGAGHGTAMEQRTGSLPDAVVDFSLQHHLGSYTGFNGGNSINQCAGIGVGRMTENVLAVAGFHDFPAIHDRDAVADVPDGTKSVADKQIGQVVLFLKLLKEIQTLCLNGNIQRGDGLIQDQEPGAEGQGTCNADALPLAAGKFMRIAVTDIGTKTYISEKGVNPFINLLGRTDAMMEHGFSQDISNALSRIERGSAVLEDHLKLRTQTAKLLWRHIVDPVSIKMDLALGKRFEAHEHAGNGGFSAPAFADDAEDLAGHDSKAHIPYGGKAV